MSHWAADLDVALTLAEAADAITVRRFGATDLTVETKPDLTPVSDADRAVEQEIRRLLAAERPGDAVLGEEYGEETKDGTAHGGGDARRWVVDPIDGTKNFVRRLPVWATLIALQAEGATVVGVVSAPALGRRWWAARGSGAWVSEQAGPPRRCAVSKVGALDDAFLSYSSLPGWAAHGRRDALLALTDSVWRTRAFGDFWQHMLVAEGALDVSCEPEVSLWDLAALQPIVEEAGGRFTDLSGVDRPDGGSVLCTNGLLHDDVLAALAPGE